MPYVLFSPPPKISVLGEAQADRECVRQEDPNSVYTFDSERDAPKSELCREGKEKGRKCIEVRTAPIP